MMEEKKVEMKVKRCKKCKSERLILNVLVFGGIGAGCQYKCRDCNYKWQEPADDTKLIEEAKNCPYLEDITEGPQGSKWLSHYLLCESQEHTEARCRVCLAYRKK